MSLRNVCIRSCFGIDSLFEVVDRIEGDCECDLSKCDFLWSFFGFDFEIIIFEGVLCENSGGKIKRNDLPRVLIDFC